MALHTHLLAKVTKHLNKYHSKLFRYCYDELNRLVIKHRAYLAYVVSRR